MEGGRQSSRRRLPVDRGAFRLDLLLRPEALAHQLVERIVVNHRRNRLGIGHLPPRSLAHLVELLLRGTGVGQLVEHREQLVANGLGIAFECVGDQADMRQRRPQWVI